MTLLMVSQHWFRLWLGALRQQAITWANVDPDLCRHMVSLGHNELTHGTSWQVTFCGPCIYITRYSLTPTEKQIYIARWHKSVICKQLFDKVWIILILLMHFTYEENLHMLHDLQVGSGKWNFACHCIETAGSLNVHVSIVSRHVS